VTQDRNVAPRTPFVEQDSRKGPGGRHRRVWVAVPRMFRKTKMLQEEGKRFGVKHERLGGNQGESRLHNHPKDSKPKKPNRKKRSGEKRVEKNRSIF